MTITFLLDMDDTLLANDMDIFVPKYLGAFSAFVASYVQPERFTKVLLAATEEMVQNRNPSKTLKDTFDEAFFPALGLDKDQFLRIADQFYDEIYPGLERYTGQIQGAVEFVNQLFNRGYQVAITTNPLFPLTAIKQRLEWAGVSPVNYDYALITSYEEFHFTKPNPAFYAEVLIKLNWVRGEVLVVGDDLERDINPAEKMGLPAFWINHQGYDKPQETSALTQAGGINDILPWVDSLSEGDLKFEFSSPGGLCAFLRATPAVFDTLRRDFAEEILNKKPVDGEWSVNEIVCHLRDVDRDVNIPRIEKILVESNTFIEGKDTHPWIKERNCNNEDSYHLFNEFITQRMNMISLLEDVTVSEWQRTANHAIFGRTTLLELVRIMVEHDLVHINQSYASIKNNLSK